MRELKVKNVTWISVVEPKEEDMKMLRERFPQIHPLVLEELLTPTVRQRVENYDNHLYLVLYFPSFEEKEKRTIAKEVDLILMPDTMITVQYAPIDILENFWRVCEKDEMVAAQYGKSPIHLLYYLLRQFFLFSLKELDQIQERIDAIEEEVFAGREKEVLEDISILKRNVLDFRRAVKPQHLTLKSLVRQGTQLYGERIKPFLTDLVGEYLKVWSLLENHKETLDALYETNNALLTAKINEIIKALTILGFITFIPTAIANIYGMNLQSLPFAERPNAFWAVIWLMIFTTSLVYVILRWRKLV